MNDILTAIADPQQSAWVIFGLIIVGTFISEDLTCLTVSLLVTKDQLNPFLGVLGCLVGIFIGDIGLYLLGRFLKWRVLNLGWVRAKLGADKLMRLGDKFDRFGWTAVLASRFLPGTRIPVYVGAGVVGHKAGRFIFWLFLAVLLWAPLIVLLGASIGPAFYRPLEALFGKTWLALLVSAVLMLALIRLVLLSLTEFGRAKMIASVSRLWRWEFWPVWFFQAPMVLVWIFLAIKYRGATVWTAANPDIMDGGLVGESKSEIISKLDPAWVASTFLLDRGELGERMALLRGEVEKRGWSLPFVLKPDASQRGEGFKIIHGLKEAEEYLRLYGEPAVAQEYHPGPREAGIFYYRIPGEDRGHIFSITDKVFPTIEGDGKSTLKRLIWNHPRYRMQAARFESRHADIWDQVLPQGQVLRLTRAGSHCQGTTFLDGQRMITEALARRLDKLVIEGYDSFYFGRFDVRYSDEERFMAGEDLTIVELNGLSAESTNVYDSKHSLFFAYKTMIQVYDLMFRIGRANVDRGYKPSTVGRIIANIRNFYRGRRTNLVSD